MYGAISASKPVASTATGSQFTAPSTANIRRTDSMVVRAASPTRALFQGKASPLKPSITARMAIVSQRMRSSLYAPNPSTSDAPGDTGKTANGLCPSMPKASK
eukprot:CAMPEP_0180779868 /NCGR_PEP_ID=MMETSP1038_2-20121128/46670_1 /TAXON_ID=632150 /ORGANISM="Azadinium spinosum, Strain 3D9" /LENGTH=102 /DNA_ID=CAMNT_0022815299 /DNA_START=499 /DNA_END=807 /DNA_ORIENTATION=+